MGEEVTQVKGKRHTPEQIVRKLREADRLQAEGADVDQVCRHLGVSATDLSALAEPVQGDAARGRGAAEGAGERECTVEADRRRAGVGYRHVAGGGSGELLSPERRRRAVTSLRDRFGVSERRACRLTSQHRSSQRYRRLLLPEEALLRERLQLLARPAPALRLPAHPRDPLQGGLGL